MISCWHTLVSITNVTLWFVSAPPEPPHNCSIYKNSSEVIHVGCSEGFNGGLKQTFILEVRNHKTKSLSVNISSPSPVFTVNGLPKNKNYILTLYSINKKGRSLKVKLSAETLLLANRMAKNGKITQVPNVKFLVTFLNYSVTLIFGHRKYPLLKIQTNY